MTGLPDSCRSHPAAPVQSATDVGESSQDSSECMQDSHALTLVAHCGPKGIVLGVSAG
jgi:hypothetical protein